jgi:hypothetical protein
MTKRNRSAVASATLVAFSLLVPCVAKAQRMAPAEGSKFAVQQSAHSQPIRVHAVSMRAATGNRNPPRVLSGVRFNTATNSFESSDGSFVSLQDLLNPVPGFGFDYHRLSVINQDLGIKAVIDPVTEWKLAVAERVHRDRARFSGSGFFLLDGGGAYAVPDDSSAATDQSNQQPQVIVVQAAPPADQNDQQTDQQPDMQTTPEESAPLPDVGQFTLVLQNGTQIQAVAFTRTKDHIVYITSDGSRRTLAVADLDSDATVRVNEERGTMLQLPL